MPSKIYNDLGGPYVTFSSRQVFGFFFCQTVALFYVVVLKFVCSGKCLGGGNSKIFANLHPGSLGKQSNLTSIFFQMGWGTNHQLHNEKYSHKNSRLIHESCLLVVTMNH